MFAGAFQRPITPKALTILVVVVVLTAVLALTQTRAAHVAAPDASIPVPALLDLTGSPAATGVDGLGPWKGARFGDNDAVFTLPAGAGRERAARVSMTRRVSGDGKWLFDAVAVRRGRTYRFEDRYRADVPTEIDVRYIQEDGRAVYAQLLHLPAATDWQTTTAEFTVPAGVVRAAVVHVLARPGVLDTADYSLRDTGAPRAARTFRRPLVSIEFDDGYASAYRRGLPIVESFGWKATVNVITETAGPAESDAYMSRDEIVDWARRGDVGSHSVTHPHLPTLAPSQRSGQLRMSRSYLDDLIGRPTRVFATPYCESDAVVARAAAALYESARDCDPQPNVRKGFNPYDLKALVVDRAVPVAKVASLLRETRASNGWLILVFHSIDGSTRPYSVSEHKLTATLDLVRRSGIDVVLTRSALDEELAR